MEEIPHDERTQTIEINLTKEGRNVMKRTAAIFLALICIAGLVGCSGTEHLLYGTVVERTDDYLLVELADDSDESNCFDQIQVGLKGKSNWPVPRVGEFVRVVYDGNIQESDSACILKPYRVEIIVDTAEENQG